MKYVYFTTVALVILASAAFAATHDVSIEGFAFVPQNISIVVGDTVRWTNNDTPPHTSTSDTMDWDSGALDNGDTFEFTFNTADSYPYHCDIHPTMTGTVNVGTSSVESSSLGELKAVFADE
ncbi:MAG: cupredoxin family copper-binding protein [bacterium]|nr:cupredoxin family copper-binding protein [bacterium]